MVVRAAFAGIASGPVFVVWVFVVPEYVAALVLVSKALAALMMMMMTTRVFVAP